MDRALASLEIWQRQVGMVNPRAPGLHNGVIQLIKRLTARAFDWYSRPLRQYHTAVSECLSAMARCVKSQQHELSAHALRAAAFQSFLRTRGQSQSDKSTDPSAVTVDSKPSIFDVGRLDVIREISPHDGMFVGDLEGYFSAGFSALECIQQALYAAGKVTCSDVLDLPCGYGRVTRMLKAAFPNARLTACDLEHDAVDFCGNVFGAVPVYAEEDPARTPLSGSFDLIWCGSLLTHLNRDRWSAFLRFFESSLSLDGVLVFTVHGRRSVRYLREGQTTYGLDQPAVLKLLAAYEREGFAYLDYPNRENYGISLSAPSWVTTELPRHPELQLVSYLEAGWDNHQDVVACRRTKGV